MRWKDISEGYKPHLRLNVAVDHESQCEELFVMAEQMLKVAVRLTDDNTGNDERVMAFQEALLAAIKFRDEAKSKTRRAVRAMNNKED